MSCLLITPFRYGPTPVPPRLCVFSKFVKSLWATHVPSLLLSVPRDTEDGDGVGRDGADNPGSSSRPSCPPSHG